VFLHINDSHGKAVAKLHEKIYAELISSLSQHGVSFRTLKLASLIFRKRLNASSFFCLIFEKVSLYTVCYILTFRTYQALVHIFKVHKTKLMSELNSSECHRKQKKHI